MKMQDAVRIINDHERGFMVNFEQVSKGGEGSVMKSDHFPDKNDGEDLIKTEEKAWEIARRFAAAVNPKEYVNIYVIDQTFRPVAGYDDKTLNRVE